MIRRIDDGKTLTFVEMTLILNNWLVGMGTTSYSEQTLTLAAGEE